MTFQFYGGRPLMPPGMVPMIGMHATPGGSLLGAAPGQSGMAPGVRPLISHQPGAVATTAMIPGGRGAGGIQAAPMQAGFLSPGLMGQPPPMLGAARLQMTPGGQMLIPGQYPGAPQLAAPGAGQIPGHMPGMHLQMQTSLAGMPGQMPGQMPGIDQVKEEPEDQEDPNEDPSALHHMQQGQHGQMQEQFQQFHDQQYNGQPDDPSPSPPLSSAQTYPGATQMPQHYSISQMSLGSQGSIGGTLMGTAPPTASPVPIGAASLLGAQHSASPVPGALVGAGSNLPMSSMGGMTGMSGISVTRGLPLGANPLHYGAALQHFSMAGGLPLGHATSLPMAGLPVGMSLATSQPMAMHQASALQSVGLTAGALGQVGLAGTGLQQVGLPMTSMAPPGLHPSYAAASMGQSMDGLGLMGLDPSSYQQQQSAEIDMIKQELGEEEEPYTEMIPPNGPLVKLDTYNSDLNLKIEPDGYSCEVLTQPMGFAFCWAGARATHGVIGGKACFEVKIVKNLAVNFGEDHKEQDPHLLRLGWAVDSASFQLGEVPDSYGYGGTGRFSVNLKFKNYGNVFSKGDVITALLDLNPRNPTISFCKNGKFMGVAQKLKSCNTPGMFPAILLKNVRVEVNFGSRPAWFDPPEGYQFLEDMAPEFRVDGMRPPERQQDCEIIMIVGLPGSGKTTWGMKTQAEHFEKRYNIIGTDTLIEKMRVNGLPRKNNYHGRWDVLIQKATQCLNTLFTIGSKLNRNYILDQTNVYASARKRKLRPFANFHKVLAVIQPDDDELKRREHKRTYEDGKFVPESAVVEMKANYILPQDGDEYVDEIRWMELPREQCIPLVDIYNRVKGTRRDSSQDRHGGRRGNERGGNDRGSNDRGGNYDNRKRSSYERDQRGSYQDGPPGEKKMRPEGSALDAIKQEYDDKPGGGDQYGSQGWAGRPDSRHSNTSSYSESGYGSSITGGGNSGRSGPSLKPNENPWSRGDVNQQPSTWQQQRQRQGQDDPRSRYGDRRYPQSESGTSNYGEGSSRYEENSRESLQSRSSNASHLGGKPDEFSGLLAPPPPPPQERERNSQDRDGWGGQDRRSSSNDRNQSQSSGDRERYNRGQSQDRKSWDRQESGRYNGGRDYSSNSRGDGDRYASHRDDDRYQRSQQDNQYSNRGDSRSGGRDSSYSRGEDQGGRGANMSYGGKPPPPPVSQETKKKKVPTATLR